MKIITERQLSKMYSDYINTLKPHEQRYMEKLGTLEASFYQFVDKKLKSPEWVAVGMLTE